MVRALLFRTEAKARRNNKSGIYDDLRMCIRHHRRSRLSSETVRNEYFSYLFVRSPASESARKTWTRLRNSDRDILGDRKNPKKEKNNKFFFLFYIIIVITRQTTVVMIKRTTT